MSGNINDTNIKLIKTQTFNLISDLENYAKSSRNISIYENILKKKYNYLYNTSKTLFDLILNQYKNKQFDKVYFNTMINKMLNYIGEIQNNKISQYDASVKIGTDLAYKYIPQFNEEQNKLTKIDEINEAHESNEVNEVNEVNEMSEQNESTQN
jgi:hypothetical protein